jgi:hypothetical protein
MKRASADLTALITFASEQAGKIFEMTGVLYPMYHAITRDGQHAILTPPDRDKDTAVAMVKAWFELNDIDRYVFVDEAWTIIAKPGDPLPDMKRIARDGLSNHPDRREVVLFSAENRRGEWVTGIRYILRPEHGKPKLSPLTIDDMTLHSEGRMVGLLQKEKKE